MANLLESSTEMVKTHGDLGQGGQSVQNDMGGEWHIQTGKRKRRSTGGTFEPSSEHVRQTQANSPNISKNTFRKMTIDDKLVTLFDMMNGVNNIVNRVQRLESSVQNVAQQADNNAHRINVLEYKSIDLEARSRRNNLIFRGIPEELLNENCDQLIRQFIRSELDIDPSEVCIQRAHRLGRPLLRHSRNSSHAQPRPLIVCFRDYQDVERVLTNAYRLRNKPSLGINRDYPLEIVQARSSIWPDYKAAKSANPKGSVFIGFPAKLIINNQVVRDEFPGWRKTLQTPRSTGPARAHDRTNDKPLAQSYSRDKAPIAATSSSPSFAQACESKTVNHVPVPGTVLTILSEPDESEMESDTNISTADSEHTSQSLLDSRDSQAQDKSEEQPDTYSQVMLGVEQRLREKTTQQQPSTITAPAKQHPPPSQPHDTANNNR